MGAGNSKTDTTKFFVSEREGGLKEDEEWHPFLGPPIKVKKRNKNANTTAPSEPLGARDFAPEGFGSESVVHRRGAGAAAAVATSADQEPASINSSASARREEKQALQNNDDGSSSSSPKPTWSWWDYIPCLALPTAEQLAAKPAYKLREPTPAQRGDVRRADFMVERERDAEERRQRAKYGGTEDGDMEVAVVPGQPDKTKQQDKRSLLLQ